MFTELAGNYFLQLKFGDEPISIDPHTIKEFTLIQDINKFLPSFRINLKDTQGILTHILPFDNKMNLVSVDIAKFGGKEITNSFKFRVYRRFPESENQTATTYDIEGLLEVDKLFVPDYCRAFTGTVKATIESLAKEIKVDQTDVSISLNYARSIVQPYWSNSQLLTYLRDTLAGSNNEYSYHCFVHRRENKSTLVFKPLIDLYRAPIKYKFVINDEPYQDLIPILDYQILDNYRLLGTFGSKQQEFSYFDYFNTRFMVGARPVDEFFSLTDTFMIDQSDSTDSQKIDKTGRSNDYTRDFAGRVGSVFFGRIKSLVHMWALTWGLENICPGDIVSVVFARGLASDSIYQYQYSGYWMVEKVIHTLGPTFKTRLLLSRSGFDTDQENSLIKAKRKKVS